MTQTSSQTQTQSLPAAIDLALFELLTTLETYSDPDFDAYWMHLSEAEVQQVALVLIQDLKANLSGKQLAGALLAIRNRSEPSLDEFDIELAQSNSTQSQP